MPHSITFRYMLFLRCTDEGICIKESKKAIKRRECWYCAHPTELWGKSKASHSSHELSVTVILRVLDYITANFLYFSWTTGHSLSQTFNWKHIFFDHFTNTSGLWTTAVESLIRRDIDHKALAVSCGDKRQEQVCHNVGIFKYVYQQCG